MYFEWRKLEIVATRKWDSLVSTDFRYLLYDDFRWQLATLKYPSDFNYRSIQLCSQNKWIIKVFALTDLKWMRCRNQKRPFIPYLVDSSSLFGVFFLRFQCVTFSSLSLSLFVCLCICLFLAFHSSIYFSIQWILFNSVRFNILKIHAPTLLPKLKRRKKNLMAFV